MVLQQESQIRFREVLDKGKIFLCKLAQGGIGVENAALLGALMVSSIQQAAMSRQEIPEDKRRNFYLYIDEFQNVMTPSLEAMLSGARKYHLGLVLAHQELRQLWSRDPEVASSVLANASTRICFRLGESDAAKLKEGFASFAARDFQNLGVGEAIARIERSDWDFNLRTLPLAAVNADLAMVRRKAIQMLSRSAYAKKREEVEAELAAYLVIEETAVPKKTTVPATGPAAHSPAIPEKSVQEMISADERSLLEYVSRQPGCFVTRAYAALGLSGYKGDKLKQTCLAKGLLFVRHSH
jgi:hypothetical protein